MPEAKPTPTTEQNKPNSKNPPVTEPKKPGEKPKVPDIKASPAADPKKPDDKSKAPDTKAPPATEPKKPDDKPKAPDAKAPPTTEPKKPDDKPKAPDAKAPPATEPKKPDDKPKAPDTKVPPAAEPKKPDDKSTAPDTKVPPATEPKKPDDKPKAPDAKAPPAADPKKPDDKPKAPDTKAAPAIEPKKPDEKPKAPDAKVPPAAEPKKPDDTPKAPDAKVLPATEPKKPDEKPKAPDAKTPPAAELKKLDEKPKAAAPKEPPAADPKKKNQDTAVEPPKGVKITQVFADRLNSPTPDDLNSLPIPKEGEGFSMRLHPAYFFEFLDHPFSVNRETQDYKELFDSIKENGINEPIKARPREGGGLELISGHRRHDVAMQLNYPVPVVIVQADDDTARIEVVDGNLHRMDIPTSELARAAKMKIEALSRKAGRRSKMEQLANPQKRTDQIVAEEMGVSRTQLTRLVRIDALVPEMKQMVDDKKLPFNTAVELSYLSPQEQSELVSFMSKEQTVPSLAQAQQMKDASQKAAKAAKEAQHTPKPMLHVVSSQTAPEPSRPGTSNSSTPAKVDSTPVSPAPSAPPAPTVNKPAPVDAKSIASIMKTKAEPELKVTFSGSELKDYFPGKTPTVAEVKRTVFEAMDLRKKALEKQAKKQELKNPVR